MKMKLTLAALALFAFSAGASATTVDFGEISDGESTGASLFYSDDGLAISDTWTFTLAEDLFTAIVIDSAEMAPFFGIDDLVATASSLDISFDYDPVDNKYTFTGLLAAGEYGFDVTGMTSGSLGGQYEVSVGGFAPIPLPPALWLLSGALLFLRRVGKKQ
jgi:hypothetical protein